MSQPDIPSLAKPGLIRGLGVVAATAIVIGTVIGTGIFRKPSVIAQSVGTPGMVFLVWIVSGVLSFFGALTYAELGAAMPAAGGDYVYMKKAYGPLWGFLFGWMMFSVGRAGSIAALATGFADYLAQFIHLGKVFISLTFHPFGLSYTFTLGTAQLSAILIIAFLTVINYFGVKMGGLVQSLFTILKVAIILLLALLGLTMSQGSWSHFQPLWPKRFEGPLYAAFGIAMIDALWAYDGWNNVNMVAGEVHKPAQNIPRALIFGTGAVMIIYLLANLAYFYVLPIETIKRSSRVAATAAEVFLGPYGASFFAVAVLLSIFAALNGSILTGARIYYAMSEDRLFFRRVAALHPVYRTPVFSLTLQSGLACAFTLAGNYDQLTTYVIFAEWIFYGMATAAVFVLRRKYPDWERPYRTWGYPYVPAIFVLMAAALVINTLIYRPAESLIGLGLILVGLPAFYYWKRRLEKPL
ncbi:MAG: amino acid permease [Acidobacteria bacterium]|nr:amino acid permease [Acidobacteriota bacterium]MBI3656106.1 amino acid permease [Acidobacteriota bacterium]